MTPHAGAREGYIENEEPGSAHWVSINRDWCLCCPALGYRVSTHHFISSPWSKQRKLWLERLSSVPTATPLPNKAII